MPKSTEIPNEMSALSSSNPSIKYHAAKRLIEISKTDPEALYGDFQALARLLDDEKNVLQWTALQVLGNLARVDKQEKLEDVYPRIVGKLDGHKLITANNAIYALTQIAKADGSKIDRTVDELLRVKGYKYDTQECNNIAVGKVILALAELFKGAKDKQAILDFVERETSNSRPATAKKANQFLKKHADRIHP